MRPLLAALFFLAAPLAAQRTPAPRARGLRAAIIRADAAADSSNFKIEFGSDVNVSQTGDSLPGDVRLGWILGNTFTLEATGAAQKDGDYLEAEVGLGVTAAIFPGATSVHGQFVEGALAYHYEGGPFQYGVVFGTGMRLVATNGIAARTGAFVEYLFPRAGIAAHTSIGAKVGISFWR